MLTLSRILICPLFLVVYLFYKNLGVSLLYLPYILLFLLLLVELSDIFDGIIARRSNQVTILGKILDPMADSIVRLSIFFAFTQGIVHLPVLLVLVFLCRDAVINTLRTLCALKGVALAARFSGKLKAVFQAISTFIILLMMIPYTLDLISLEALREVSFWVVLMTAIYTALSGIEYIWAYRSFIKQAWMKA